MNAINYSTRNGIERCESPLEEKLAHAFSDLARFQWREPTDHAWEIGKWPGWFLTLLAQAELEPYRVDFAISTWVHDEGERLPFIVIVEVDGHDYHERTKEQAEYDKSRDRFMTALDLKVFRFTGREVWRDAEVCAYEVLGYVTKIQQAHLDADFIKFLKTYHQQGGDVK